MGPPPVKKRKHQRSLQQKGSAAGDGDYTTASRLNPNLANIDKHNVSTTRSIVSSAPSGSDRRPLGLRLATSIPATPEGNTVSDLTTGVSDKFNAFRV